MLYISGNAADAQTFAEQYPSNSVESKIIEILSSSSEVYSYQSPEHLKFELNLRSSIIKASKELYKSHLLFKTFRESICNTKYWDRTGEGGFKLNNGIIPSDAIEDIFTGRSRYGTECATAIMIVYYRALQKALPPESFNTAFPDIYLMNWQHTDSLGVELYRNQAVYLPGDCRYFKNPDVDPLTPEWQGENAIDCGNGIYYGHGIGFATSDLIIEALNTHRVNDSQTSAYLMDSATRPDFKKLAGIH